LDRAVLVEQMHRAALGGTGARPLQHLNLMLAFLCWLTLHGQPAEVGASGAARAPGGSRR
jgi:hypothetical protein